MSSEGGLILSPDGEDSIPVRLLPGEQVYDSDGRLLFVAVEDDLPTSG